MGRRWISAPPQPEPLLREPKKIETSVNGVGGNRQQKAHGVGKYF